MNKKCLLIFTCAWLLSCAALYFFRSWIALFSLPGPGIPDAAFAILPDMEKAVTRTLAYASALQMLFAGLLYSTVRFVERKRAREEPVSIRQK